MPIRKLLERQQGRSLLLNCRLSDKISACDAANEMVRPLRVCMYVCVCVCVTCVWRFKLWFVRLNREAFIAHCVFLLLVSSINCREQCMCV